MYTVLCSQVEKLAAYVANILLNYQMDDTHRENALIALKCKIDWILNVVAGKNGDRGLKFP